MNAVRKHLLLGLFILHLTKGLVLAALPDLAVSQTVNPTNLAVGEPVVFTVQLANFSFLPVSNITVVVGWPPGVALTTFTNTAGSSFSPDSGVWAIDSLSVSQAVVLTLTGTVQTPGTHTNNATLTDSSPPDFTAYNNFSQATVTATNAPAADLELMARATSLSPAINSAMTIQATVTNRGPDDASGIVVSNSLPPGLTFMSGSAVASVGGYSEGSRQWIIGDLPANGSATLSFNVLSALTGSWTNRLEIIAGTPGDPDSPHGNGMAGEDDQVDLAINVMAPALTLGQSVSPGSLTLCWDVAAGNYQVLAATNLLPPVNWQPYSVPVYTVGTQRKAYIPTTNPPPVYFFKLGSTPYVLPPPVILVSQHDDYVSLMWETVPGAQAYNVRAYDQPPVPGVTLPVYSLMNVTDTSVNVASLPSGQTFYFTVTSVSAAGEGAESLPATGGTGPFSEVYGQVFAEVARGNQKVTVNLQGVSVYASNVVSGTIALVTASGADGGYDLNDVGAGTWSIGWSGLGIVPGFTTTNLMLTNNSVLLPIPVQLATNATEDAVVAQVTLADGTVPVLFEPFWDVNVRPQVTLLNSSNAVVASGSVADDGSVVLLPPVPKTGVNYTLRATVEAATVDVPLNGVPSTVVQVVIPNRPPAVAGVSATQSGQTVLRALPGSTVQFAASATDPDGDPLSFEWRVNSSLIAPAPTNSATPNWTVPAENGAYFAYVMARDGRGGYAFSRVTLIASDSVRITGTVTTDDPLNPTPLAGATVTVNGVTTNTTASGFDVSVPLATNYYIVQATCPGFAPANVFLIDPASYLEIPLQPLATNRINLAAGQPTNVMTSSGLMLDIPADSVQTTNGLNYTGPMDIESAVLDPCDPAIFFPSPRVIYDPDLGAGYMTAYAAGFLALKNPATGEDLQLSPLNPGLLGLPVGPNCATNAVLPPTLRRGLFSTDFLSGATNAITTVTTSTNIFVGTNQLYFGNFTQGGRFNDYQWAPLTTVKITADRTINFPFVARVSHTLAQPESRTVFDDALSGLFTVEVGETVKVNVLGLKEAPGEYFHDVSPGQADTPDTSKTVIASRQILAGSGTNLVRMSLTNLAPELTPAVLDTISRPQHFLAKGYENYINLGAAAAVAQASNYYAAIQAPATFDQWKSLHGFSSPSNLLSAAAQYYNVIDLGFARSMAMTVGLGPDGKTNVAYYVTNYRTVEDAIATKNPIATVAMDYAALKTGDERFTKFYVYDGPKGLLLTVANLDNVNNGDKPVPNLCVVCHGGKFVKTSAGNNTPADGNLGAVFLPFDLEAYTFSLARGIQRAELAKLNQGVLYTEPTAAIQELILGWYGGVPGGAQINFNQNFVPPAWSNNVANLTFYRDAFKTSCRGCHISRDKAYFDGPDAFLEAVSRSETVVKKFTMPNSQRTFGIFWGSHTAQILNTNTWPDQVQAYRNVTGQ